MAKANYRTTRDIVIPAGTPIMYIRSMKHHVTHQASALVNIAPNMSFDWMMYFDDAFTIGLVEEIPQEEEAAGDQT